jgi:hypothetical protein
MHCGSGNPFFQNTLEKEHSTILFVNTCPGKKNSTPDKIIAAMYFIISALDKIYNTLLPFYSTPENNNTALGIINSAILLKNSTLDKNNSAPANRNTALYFIHTTPNKKSSAKYFINSITDN